MPNRRTVLRGIGALGVGSLALRGVAHADPDPWTRAAYISARVRRPRFPNRWFDITRFGAVGDGVTDCTAAIRRAIADCHRAGGGHVVVPAGRFLTGAIQLRSGVDLHVTGGARVLFSQDPAHYLPVVLTRFEGVELYNYSPLIYAFGQRNIAVTGSVSSMDSPTWSTGGHGAARPGSAGSRANQGRPRPERRCSPRPSRASRSLTGSTATAAICARRSSSPTGAATS